MEIVEKRILHAGEKFDVALHRLRAKDGAMFERAYIDHPGSVVICPILPGGKLVFVDNFRHSVGRRVLELPAGTGERGEDPARTAARELEEETGYRAGRWTASLAFYACPGASTEWMRLFFAEDLKEGPRSLEPDEDLAVAALEVSDALERIRDGRIHDAKTILGVWEAARRMGEREDA